MTQERCDCGSLDKVAALVFVFGSALAAIAFSRQLADEFRVDDDARQHLVWMAQYHDPELFPRNPYVEYARYYSTPLFKAVYCVLVQVADPLAAGKRLAVLLAGLSALLVFAWGRSLGGTGFGLISALVYLSMPAVFEPFSGGLQRAFSAPLLLGVLILLSANRHEWVGFLMTVAMLLYPVSAALCLMTVVISSLMIRPTLTARRRVTLAAGLTLFVAAAAWTAWQRTCSRPAFLGRFVTKAEALADPAFQRHGRFRLVPTPSYWTAVAEEPALVEPRCRRLFFAGLLVLAALLARRSPDGGSGRARIVPALAFLASSVVLFHLADWLFLKLFVPIRYVQHPFSILVPLVVALCPAGFVALFRAGTVRRLLAVVVAAVLAGAALENARRQAPGSSSLGPREEERSLFRFLGTLPRATLVGADPFLSDNIMAFSQRSTFLSYELAHPWFVGYRELFEGRVDDYYRAVFSADPLAARDFACRNGVDYFVLTRKHFASPRPGPLRLFFEPEESRLRAQLAGVDPRRSALLQAPPERRVFENDRYLVVRGESCGPP